MVFDKLIKNLLNVSCILGRIVALLFGEMKGRFLVLNAAFQKIS